MTSNIASDDYLVALRATRDAILADLDGCESYRDRAALYSRLESILTKIDAASTKKAADDKPNDPIDELAARRAARGGATSRLGQAARRPG